MAALFSLVYPLYNQVRCYFFLWQGAWAPSMLKKGQNYSGAVLKTNLARRTARKDALKQSRRISCPLKGS